MALPLNVLEKTLNQRLSLLLKDGRVLEGKLTGFDDYMNMVLEDCEEHREESQRRITVCDRNGCTDYDPPMVRPGPDAV